MVTWGKSINLKMLLPTNRSKLKLTTASNSEAVFYYIMAATVKYLQSKLSAS